MSHHTKLESGVFRQQAVEEIAAELQLENDELVRALVELRLPPSHALRQQVRAITNTEQVAGTGKADEVSQGKTPTVLPRLLIRAGVVVSVLLMAVFLLIATVPSVRAAFDRIMQQRFGLVLIEPTLEATIATDPEDNSEVLTEVEIIPPISFEEVQTQAPFTIPMPALLPEGLELWAPHMTEYPPQESSGPDGTLTDTEPQVVVVLTYKPTAASIYDPSAALTLIVTNQIDLEGGYAVAVGAEESVEVKGHPAVFARGSWHRVNENEPPDLANAVWDGSADAAMLSWEANGFTYTLQGYLLGLSREEYIQIAESVR
jgi:hypothetical protein